MKTETEVDWHKWHGRYRNQWPLKVRLRLVQGQIKKALAETPDGKILILSICAGDGRDLSGALSRHRRSKDVSAVLLELDENLVADGKAEFERLGLAGNVDYRTADATDPATYKGVGAADIVLACGMLGLVSPDSTPKFVQTLASFLKPGGHLIWTRSLILRSGPEHLKEFKNLLAKNGFEERSFQITPRPPFFIRGRKAMARFVVGRHQYQGGTKPRPKGRLFQIDDL